MPQRSVYLRTSATDVHRDYAPRVHTKYGAIVRAIERLDPEAASLAARSHMQESRVGISTGTPLSR